jgi:hypothetical protein
MITDAVMALIFNYSINFGNESYSLLDVIIAREQETITHEKFQLEQVNVTMLNGTFPAIDVLKYFYTFVIYFNIKEKVISAKDHQRFLLHFNYILACQKCALRGNIDTVRCKHSVVWCSSNKCCKLALVIGRCTYKPMHDDSIIIQWINDKSVEEVSGSQCILYCRKSLLNDVNVIERTPKIKEKLKYYCCTEKTTIEFFDMSTLLTKNQKIN